MSITVYVNAFLQIFAQGGVIESSLSGEVPAEVNLEYLAIPLNSSSCSVAFSTAFQAVVLCWSKALTVWDACAYRDA